MKHDYDELKSYGVSLSTIEKVKASQVPMFEVCMFPIVTTVHRLGLSTAELKELYSGVISLCAGNVDGEMVTDCPLKYDASKYENTEKILEEKVSKFKIETIRHGATSEVVTLIEYYKITDARNLWLLSRQQILDAGISEDKILSISCFLNHFYEVKRHEISMTPPDAQRVDLRHFMVNKMVETLREYKVPTAFSREVVRQKISDKESLKPYLDKNKLLTIYGVGDITADKIIETLKVVIESPDEI